ncbi:MAG: hypothetical protein WA880_00055, partial [Ornithinimicrobium sp.]
LRSIVHAGGCVTGAYAEDGALVGAAALTPSVPSVASYSFIAAARSGSSDTGIGYAIKTYQRSWALTNGFTTMSWTFDPLVSRNARFNLVKLGAVAEVYEVAFYGQPTDEISGCDEADRLVARWALDSERVLAAAEVVINGFVGTPQTDSAVEAARHPPLQSVSAELGPDGSPMLARLDVERWCRVPRDIVALRRSDPDQASAWRMAVRAVFTEAFREGLHATSMSRDGWYRLTAKGTS